MSLNWEQTQPGILSAATNPFQVHMSLQNSWDDKQSRNIRYLESEIDIPGATRRRLASSVLAYDRIRAIDPEIKFRIKDDGFGVPCFTPNGQTYRPIKRVDAFLHFSPTLSLSKEGSDRETLPLWGWFHLLADDEQQAQALTRAVAAILPGTRIADPGWVLELDRKLGVERWPLKNFPAHRRPLDYIEDVEGFLETEFEWVRSAAQEACCLIRRPDLKTYLDSCGFFRPGLSPSFDMACAGKDRTTVEERRRAMMVQTAVMACVQGWPLSPEPTRTARSSSSFMSP